MEFLRARLQLSSCSCLPFELLLRDIGLTIARDKTEVAPACSAVQDFTPGDIEGCTWVADGNVKLLGAAIGTQAWCESLLGRRVGKAHVLLDAIARYDDSQGACALLRSCTRWAKILYSCRAAPPSLQASSLGTADRDIRNSLGRLVGGTLSDEDWRLASIGEASELVAHWNTLPPHKFQVWSNPKSFARASGQASMSTTSTEASDGPRLNPISFLGSCPVPGSKVLPARRPRKASRPRSRPKLLAIFSTPLLRSTTAGPTSASIAFLELQHGLSRFRTPSGPTLLRPYSGSVAFACPSGPRTRTAPSADKSWTNRVTTPWFADAAAGARLGSFCRQLRSQPGHCLGKAGPLVTSGPHRRRSRPGC